MIRSFVSASILLVSATFASAAAAQPGTAATTLDGVYEGFRISSMLNGTMVQSFLTLFRDGRVLEDHPDEGLARAPDWARVCKKSRCGTYTLSGGRVGIRWSGGGAASFTIEPGGTLRESGSVRRYRLLAPLDGLRLEGVYVFRFSDGRVVTGITFAADGRFREFNLLPGTSWVLRGSMYWGDERRARRVVDEGAGTYTIARNTLELRYENGLVARLWIFVPPGLAASATVPTIYVEGTRLERAQ